MKYEIRPTSTFKKDVKRIVKQGRDLTLLGNIIDTLAAGLPLDAKYKDHPLTGNYVGKRECHILPDWLLIYEYDHGNLILILSRTGSHSHLFN